MNKKKYSYPKGIYANRFEHTPDFVFAEIKMDREKAIAELQACDQPYLYLQVLRSFEPDEKGNHAFIAVHDYMMDRQREKAIKGIQQAKAVLKETQPHGWAPSNEHLLEPRESIKSKQPKPLEISADDIPF